MDLFNLDSDTAKNLGLGTVAFSIIGLLLVLKFVKSLVSKMLLLAVFGVLAYFSITQREALSICIAKLESVAPSELSTTSCSFFGQDISLKSISK
ncbi:MAG: hypothetical protein EBU84_00145 [Actinobacteria bacterium]|nr:hypothetical protein [Actinomycetota bacterium]